MEIRVYASLNCLQTGKYLYCRQVECPDGFSFENTLSVFRSLYGPKVIVVFLCV